VRRVIHGQAYFDEGVKRRVLELMQFQCSAKRSAYQAVRKHGLKGNDVKIYVKKNYTESLNVRYISDACTQASMIKHESALFGGKRAWKKLQTETITKEEWKQRRNNQLYSRGEKSHNGNANIRIFRDRIIINDPSGRGKWIEGKLYLDGDWNKEIYSVQIIYRDDKFEVVVSWEESNPKQIVVKKGAIGIDVNVDGVAMVEVDGNGNLLNHKYIRKQRIQFARYNKRKHDINELAKEVVCMAAEARKKIVVEKIKISQNKRNAGGKKPRRKKNNFASKKVIGAIKSRAIRCGVPVIEVNPAYTTVLGFLKYAKMYSLSKHDAAALVIARRGLGIKERQTYTVTTGSSKKLPWNLEGRSGSIALSEKAYSWLNRGNFVRSKQANLTGSGLVAEIEVIDSATRLSVGETPTGESCPITGRAGHANGMLAMKGAVEIC